jgi:hypothetical protein
MVVRFNSITPGAQLSDQVAEVLVAEIRAGRLAVGEKLPTEAVTGGAVLGQPHRHPRSGLAAQVAWASSTPGKAAACT